MRHPIHLIAAALALLPAGVEAGGEAPDARTVVAGELGKRLDHAVQVTSGGGLWGVVLVAREGRILLAKGYGYADYASRPNTPASLFEIASVSKQFTAAAVVKLAQQGKLKLGDPLRTFFPDAPADKQPITLRELLTHTSGLSPEVGLPYASPLKRDAAVARLLRTPVAAPRGSRFAYSNAGYAILAAVVEKASGRAFEDYLRAELFAPAGLKDTGFIRDRHLDAARATVRLSKDLPGTALDWFWGWGYRGMGGVVTTARDLLRWHQALRGTKVLDAAHKKLLFTPARRNYACGWFVETTTRGTKRQQHSGSVAGYEVDLVRYPQEDAVIAVLSNGKSDLRPVTRVLEETLFPPPHVTLAVDASPFTLSRWQAADLNRAASWRVKRAGGDVVLTLVHATKRHTAARLTVPLGVARKLATDLRSALKTKGPRRAGEKAATESGLYLGGYRLQEGRLELREGLQLRVMPRYVGADAKGKRIVDERITLVVADRARGQWPVMAKLNTGAARALLAALDSATPPGAGVGSGR